MTTPGSGFVQAPPSGIADLTGNATYADIFKTFSPLRLFAPELFGVHSEVGVARVEYCGALTIDRRDENRRGRPGSNPLRFASRK